MAAVAVSPARCYCCYILLKRRQANDTIIVLLVIIIMIINTLCIGCPAITIFLHYLNGNLQNIHAPVQKSSVIPDAVENQLYLQRTILQNLSPTLTYRHLHVFCRILTLQSPFFRSPKRTSLIFNFTRMKKLKFISYFNYGRINYLPNMHSRLLFSNDPFRAAPSGSLGVYPQQRELGCCKTTAAGNYH